MVLLGYPEYREHARHWGARILSMQKPDGSFAWSDFQFRNIIGLERAWLLTGDERFKQGFERALATIEYRPDGLYWKGAPAGGDFVGALPTAIFGSLGRTKELAQVLKLRANYINDEGFQACSDLNPYMLGFSLRALELARQPRKQVGLREFVRYDEKNVQVLAAPTCYAVNLHNPVAKAVSFPLPDN